MHQEQRREEETTYSIAAHCATKALHISITPQLASRLLCAGRHGLDKLASIVVRNHESHSISHIPGITTSSMTSSQMRKQRLPLICADAKQEVVGCVTALALWFYIIMLPRAWKSATIKLHNYPDLVLQGDRCRVKC